MASKRKKRERKKLLRRWHLWRTRKPRKGEIDDYGMRLWMEWYREIAALEAKHGQQAQTIGNDRADATPTAREPAPRA